MISVWRILQMSIDAREESTGLYRRLDAREEDEFRQWARDNFVPGVAAKASWHPVVRAEWGRLQDIAWNGYISSL